MSAFVIPIQLRRANVPESQLYNFHCSNSKYLSPRPTVFRVTPTGSQTTWPSHSSSALNYDNASKTRSPRYIDLRTMNIILPDNAHLDPAPPSNPGFSALNNFQISTKSQTDLRQLLFTSDTLPLTDSQKDVVHALLSHHSVLYTSACGDEKHGIFLDIVLRSRVWKECVVYCASSRRVAESVFATLCAQLGTERRNEVLLHLGDGSPQRPDGSVSLEDPVRVVITSPPVLRNAIVNLHSGGWFENISVLFIDNINDETLRLWEELLLAVPSNILLCLLSSHLTRSHLELLPIWVETIQNTTSIVNPVGPSSILNRIERPHNMPLLRTFAYNAAVHQAPVQVSLVILKEMLQKEIEDASIDSIPDYEQSFLHGITMIPAQDPTKLLFRNVAEATYADVSALIVADAIRTEELRSKNKKRSRSRRKERTPASRAAARRRREVAYSESMLLPAIVLVKGHDKVFQVAQSVLSALGSTDLLWDVDTKDHVESIVNSFMEAWIDQLTDLDKHVLELLVMGIGVVNDMYTPSLRLLVEELFRAGLIPVLTADTHLGSGELWGFPQAKSVLVESGSLATCDDATKGLLLASTAASLAGRSGRDDVGNLILMWYDESVDDESAGHEIATTLLSPELTNVMDKPEGGNVEPTPKEARRSNHGFGTLDSLEVHQRSQSDISSSYDTVLRSVQRFGVDGYESLFEYTLSSFKGWLKRAALHATLEKLGVEKKAIDERVNSEDWDTIADYERKTAKLNEVQRVYSAMTARFKNVLQREMLGELKQSSAGRIIGVKASIHRNDDALAKDRLGPKSKNDADIDEASLNGLHIENEVGKLQLVRDSSLVSSRLSSAVYVNLFDQQVLGKQIGEMDSRYLVVCILADGIWTMVPLQDVEALSRDEDELVANVDLLTAPHPATFDVEPGMQRAKCAPVDEAEQAAVHRVSDELIARVASEEPPQLEKLHVPEFDAQREHMKKLEDVHCQSMWYDREEELKDLRRLRRRAAELDDEMNTLRNRKQQFEEQMISDHNDRRSIQTSLMAVLEDCHALSFLGDMSIEMTPIGALASLLPCEHPVFAGACLCLIEDIDQLSVPEFAAFIATVVSNGRLWSKGSSSSSGNGVVNAKEDEEPFDIFRKRQTHRSDRDDDNADEFGNWDVERRMLSVEAESLKGLLPPQVSELIVEIQQALRQLHRRHLGECQAAERVWVNEIVPTMLNIKLAQAATQFADGGDWHKIPEMLGNEGGYAIREMRRILSVIEFIWKDQTHGEFSDQAKRLAGKTYQALNRWPIRDNDTILKLLDCGVIERPWNGNTYEKWWKSLRETMKAKGENEGSGLEDDITESVEVEIVES